MFLNTIYFIQEAKNFASRVLGVVNSFVDDALNAVSVISKKHETDVGIHEF